MRFLSRSHQLIATLTIHLACASLGHAFEQSSYFIFDIIDSATTKPVAGRLAVKKEALTTVKAETKSHTQISSERGEFEIDFNQPIQASDSGAATFTFDQVVDTPASTESSSFGTESFDLGTSDSIFGQ
ncbi:hypothetical protein SH580_08935 [Coraliomargarita algicola]|uniref:Uncharacterized protein n=1 Tax=Coraliomargarita algicola TaxID=3092156 RepID=A0ABZ0RXU5_9BACT|nr:hypothetical protein [Coraliomargarita sp. J2-16]WPJ97834.1 hypothetical protein SH580_08935 [Coraliomargarita sp. J2-16]